MSEIHELEVYWDRIIRRLSDQEEERWLQQKIARLTQCGQVQRVTVNLYPYHRIAYEGQSDYHFTLHTQFLIKDGRQSYLEEGQYRGKATFLKGKLCHQSIETETLSSEQASSSEFDGKQDVLEERFTYNRREAVRYAERWWDSYNPAYRHFDVDCTNYVSQCLRAGGAPMWGAPNRSKGWWYSGKSWSYSWAVAHALRWYLSGARQGLTAKEMSSADQLLPGDVICYDFQGNGRFDHNTIVVKMNSEGMPLVNAHTSNSRHRYWAYEDSTAYTPNIQYKFFRIGG